MDFETLTRMDAEADELIKSWSSGTFSENASIETCTKKMGIRLDGVYGTALSPDQLAEYGKIAGEFLWDQGLSMGFGYVVSKIGGALKQVYHDRSSGKNAPKPEEFRSYILHAKGGIITLTGCKATLTVTHKDGSVD